MRLGLALLVAITCTTQRIGPFTYTDCSDGTSITGQDIGPFHYDDITPPLHRFPRVVPVPVPHNDDDQGDEDQDDE